MGTIITTNGQRILLLRHGQCKSNVSFDLSTYREADDGLTVLGNEQASQAGTAIAHMIGTKKPALVSSTLVRATQTASIVAASLGGAEIRLDERFAELSDMEDEASFLSRIAAALCQVVEARRHAIIVTHGHVIQGIIASSLRIPFSQTKTLYPFNGGITTLNNGALESFNMHQHLDPMSIV